MRHQWAKDPDAVLDWSFDWTAWLAEGETITSHDVFGDGVTVGVISESDGVVTAWLSQPEPGFRRVTCRITTNQGRTDDRSIRIHVRDR